MNKKQKVQSDAVIVFLRKDDEILLAYKPKHKEGEEIKIGEECWNGYGGGIEEHEEPSEAAVRELYEEARVVARSEDFEKVGLIEVFTASLDGPTTMCNLHVFVLDMWVGEIKETETMLDPHWFKIQNLPFEKMMLADIIWMPKIFQEKKVIRGRFFYGPSQQTLLPGWNMKEEGSFE